MSNSSSVSVLIAQLAVEQAAWTRVQIHKVCCFFLNFPNDQIFRQSLASTFFPYLRCNLPMTRSSVATSLWDHPVWRPAMGDLQYWWSLVRSHLDLMMSQCCSNYNCPWTRKSFAASCHQAPFVNLAALLCSSLEKKMLSKKYGNVQQFDQSFHQSVDFVLHARTYSLIPQNMQVGLIEDSKLSNRSLSHSNRWIIRFAHIMSKLQNSQDSSWQWTDKTI